MIERQCGRHSPARCPLDKSCLDQKRLINVFDGILFFADGSGQGLDPDGSAGKFVDQREQQHRIHFVEPEPVHFEHEQGFVGQPPGDRAVAFDLGVVAHPAQQAVGDARRAA